MSLYPLPLDIHSNDGVDDCTLACKQAQGQERRRREMGKAQSEL